MMANDISREKILRKLGDSVGVIFNKEERILYGLNVGDAVKVSVKKIRKTNEVNK